MNTNNDKRPGTARPHGGHAQPPSVYGTEPEFGDDTMMLSRGAIWALIVEALASVLVALTIVAQAGTEVAAIWLVVVWSTLVLRGLWCHHLGRVDARYIDAWRSTLGFAMVFAGVTWGSAAFFLTAATPGDLHTLLIVEVATTLVVGAVLLSANLGTAAAYAGGGLAALALASSVGPAGLQPLDLGVAAVAAGVAAVLIAFVRVLVAQGRRMTAMLQVATNSSRSAIEAKSHFVANMSHELRTPLNAIIGFADLILSRPFGDFGDKRYGDYVTDIRDSGRHLLDVINDILDLSKIEVGRMELRDETVDVGELIDRCVRIMSVTAQKGGVELSARLPDKPLQLIADERSLKQIILNLVSNAIKFTPLKGSVNVDLRELPTGEIEIAVSDTGIGMAPEHIAIAMEPFGQVDSALARRFEGTGLGLPLVKSLTEMQDGRFKLESELANGTTARVIFPLHRRPGSATDPFFPDTTSQTKEALYA